MHPQKQGPVSHEYGNGNEATEPGSKAKAKSRRRDEGLWRKRTDPGLSDMLSDRRTDFQVGSNPNTLKIHPAIRHERLRDERPTNSTLSGAWRRRTSRSAGS